jgi:hypothetical protein
MSLIMNYLNPLEFKVTISRLPHVEFFTQQTSIPAISSSPVRVPTRYNATFRSGDEVSFSNLDLTFIVDEAMENYREIYTWIINANFPNSSEQYQQIADTLYSDISVIIMNSKKNPNILFTYRNCFPIGLSDVPLNTTDSDVTYPQVTATFQYDTFDMETIT